MTATLSDRFGVYTWTQDADEFTRAQMNTSHTAVEQLASKFFIGSAAPPTPGTKIHVGAVYYRTTNGVLYWYTGSIDFGTGVFTVGSWIPLNEYAQSGDLQATTAGGSSATGSSTRLARADHSHALAASVTPSAVSTAAAVGTSSSVARGDHVHALASSSINSSTLFSAGVVNETAIASAAVTSVKIKSSASVDADRSITSDHVKDNAVIERTINNGAVTINKLGSSTIIKSKIHTANSGGPGVYYNATGSGGGAITYGTIAPAGSANEGDIYLRYI